jgi:hypothetical protein
LGIKEHETRLILHEHDDDDDDDDDVDDDISFQRQSQQNLRAYLVKYSPDREIT